MRGSNHAIATGQFNFNVVWFVLFPHHIFKLGINIFNLRLSASSTNLYPLTHLKIALSETTLKYNFLEVRLRWIYG